MFHLGTLRDMESFGKVEDVRGAEVYGINDEKLGTIDDVIFDHGTGDIRYAVVDTGGWLSSRKFLVPAARIEPYGKDPDKFYASLDQQRIEAFPEYDEKLLDADDKWRDYERRFDESWAEEPVQHLKGTDRNITPPASELPPARPVEGYTPDLAPERITGKSPEPIRNPGGVGTEYGAAPTRHVPGQIATGDLGRSARWNVFQERLRERRSRFAETCEVCRSGRREVA